MGNCRVDLEIFNFMSFHGLLVLTPVWLGQMGRIGLGSPNRSPSSRYYLGSQFLFIPAHQSFLQGTCFLRPTLDQCAMVEPMEPRVLAGGVKTVENGRVDRVFEIVRPRFSGRWGNISLYVRR